MWCVCCSDSRVQTDSHPLVVFPCGLTAGCLAAIVTHPADVIKTHLQLKQAQRGATRHAVYNILQVIVIILASGHTGVRSRQSCCHRGLALASRIFEETIWRPWPWMVRSSPWPWIEAKAKTFLRLEKSPEYLLNQGFAVLQFATQLRSCVVHR